MRLLVQIPCFNEAGTLPRVIADIPRQIPGFSSVEILVIDDGSTDGTAPVAEACGADHIRRHPGNQGLARAFRTGLEACLQLGADVIVNTDGDHQYPGGAIAELARPILEGRADLVIGDRQPAKNPQLSLSRRLLQALGSFLVRRVSGTDVPDAVSGFRALSRDAALRINIVSSFSYTIEMLVQAGVERMRIVSIPIAVNPPSRPSRLYRGVPQFLIQSFVTLLRTYAMYQPLRLFFTLGTLLVGLGFVPIVRFLIFYASGQGAGHLQSLVLGGVSVVLGVVVLVAGVIADLIAFNRRLLELQLVAARRLEYDAGNQHDR